MQRRLSGLEKFRMIERQQIMDECNRLHIRPRREPANIPGPVEQELRGVQIDRPRRRVAGRTSQTKTPVAQGAPVAQDARDAGPGLYARSVAPPSDPIDDRAIDGVRCGVSIFTPTRFDRVHGRERGPGVGKAWPQRRAGQRRRAVLEKMPGQQKIDAVDSVWRGIESTGDEPRDVVNDRGRQAPLRAALNQSTASRTASRAGRV